MAAEDHDLLGSESPGGDHAAEPDGAVAADRDRLSGTDLRDDRGMVAGAHHISQGEERRHQLLVGVRRQRVERAVGECDAERLRLGSADAVGAVAEEPSGISPATP